MILYHGTNESFNDIELTKSKIGKDFGIGFYLTPDESVATRQAQRKFAQFGTGDINVIAYEWQNTNDLKICEFDDYTIEWAKFILTNRKNRTKIQVHNYDIVIGPIADDTVGYQVRRLEDGIISMRQFLKEIKYNHITFQYLFATNKSIRTLRRL